MTLSLDLMDIAVSSTPEGCVVNLLVQPRASRTELAPPLDGALKVRLTSPPVDEAANECCIAYFAKLLKLSRNRLRIVSGATSRHKRLSIRGISPEEFRTAISPTLTTNPTRRS